MLWHEGSGLESFNTVKWTVIVAYTWTSVNMKSLRFFITNRNKKLKKKEKKTSKHTHHLGNENDGEQERSEGQLNCRGRVTEVFITTSGLHGVQGMIAKKLNICCLVARLHGKTTHHLYIQDRSWKQKTKGKLGRVTNGDRIVDRILQKLNIGITFTCFTSSHITQLILTAVCLCSVTQIPESKITPEALKCLSCKQKESF